MKRETLLWLQGTEEQVKRWIKNHKSLTYVKENKPIWWYGVKWEDVYTIVPRNVKDFNLLRGKKLKHITIDSVIKDGKEEIIDIEYEEKVK